MGAILNVVWDYRRKGFYIDERHAPLRYRTRRFLESRFIPALQAVLLAVCSAVVWTAENIAWPVFNLLIQWVFVRRGLGRELKQMSRMYLRDCRRESERIATAVLLVLPLAMVALFGVTLLFLFAGFFLLLGKAAERGLMLLAKR